MKPINDYLAAMDLSTDTLQLDEHVPNQIISAFPYYSFFRE